MAFYIITEPLRKTVFMKTRGKCLFRCDECKSSQYEHWTAENRRARIRCNACGSARMEKSGRGQNDEAERQRAASEADGTGHYTRTK